MADRYPRVARSLAVRALLRLALRLQVGGLLRGLELQGDVAGLGCVGGRRRHGPSLPQDAAASPAEQGPGEDDETDHRGEQHERHQDQRDDDPAPPEPAPSRPLLPPPGRNRWWWRRGGWPGGGGPR